MKKILYMLISCFFISTCGPKLSRFHKSVETCILSIPDIQKYVTATFTTSPSELFKEKNETKTVFDLSDNGQAEYLKHSSKYFAERTFDSFRQNIAKGISTEDRPSDFLEHILFVKRIEIDITDVLYKAGNKANRIDQLTFIIRLADPDEFKFISFKDFSTKYDVVEFGDISRSVNTKFSIGFEEAPASAGFEIGSSRDENINLKVRSIAAKGSLTESSISIYMEGNPQKNINEKVEFEVVIEAKNLASEPLVSFSGLYNEKGDVVYDPTKLSLIEKFLIRPMNMNDVKVDFSYGFLYREVINKKGKKTVPEFDDKVRYCQGSIELTNRDYVLIKFNELHGSMFEIMKDKRSLALGDQVIKFSKAKF